MWCIFTLFHKKKPLEPRVLVDPKVNNPLNLDELPDTLSQLKILESVLVDHLVSLHYEIERAKSLVGKEFKKGSSERGRNALANRVILSEKKKLFEKRLERVQEKIRVIRKN
jgi:hypothetical protein